MYEEPTGYAPSRVISLKFPCMPALLSGTSLCFHWASRPFSAAYTEPRCLCLQPVNREARGLHSLRYVMDDVSKVTGSTSLGTMALGDTGRKGTESLAKGGRLRRGSDRQVRHSKEPALRISCSERRPRLLKVHDLQRFLGLLVVSAKIPPPNSVLSLTTKSDHQHRWNTPLQCLPNPLPRASSSGIHPMMCIPPGHRSGRTRTRSLRSQ